MAPINLKDVFEGPVRPVLIATVGLPYSGKSTWARRQGLPIVSPDAVRLALHGQRYAPAAEPFVWASARAMAAALFLAGHMTVIFDATNVSRKRRRELLDGRWDTQFKVLDAAAGPCIGRAAAARDAEIIPVIARMAAEWEPLGPDEYAYLDTPGTEPGRVAGSVPDTDPEIKLPPATAAQIREEATARAAEIAGRAGQLKANGDR